MSVIEAYALGVLTAPALVFLVYVIRNIDKNPDAW